MDGLGGPSRSPTSTVFIGNIPYDVTEQMLADIFSQAGPIKALRLVTDKDTGKQKGYGFCEFHDVQTAQSAVRNLNKYEVGGRMLRVDFADEHMGEPRLKKEKDVGGRPMRGPDNPTVPAPPPGIRPVGREASGLAAQHMNSLLGNAPYTGPSQDKITTVIAGMTPVQLFEIMSQMRTLVQQNQNAARSILVANPQLTKALFQAQVLLGMVKGAAPPPSALGTANAAAAAAPTPPGPAPPPQGAPPLGGPPPQGAYSGPPPGPAPQQQMAPPPGPPQQQQQMQQAGPYGMMQPPPNQFGAPPQMMQPPPQQQPQTVVLQAAPGGPQQQIMVDPNTGMQYSAVMMQQPPPQQQVMQQQPPQQQVMQQPPPQQQVMQQQPPQQQPQQQMMQQQQQMQQQPVPQPAAPAPAAAPSLAPQQAAVLQQVLQLSQAQIDALPPMQRQQVMLVRQQLGLGL